MHEPIVGIASPVPLSLVPELLGTVQEWHDRECDTEGCEPVLLADPGPLALVVAHRVREETAGG